MLISLVVSMCESGTYLGSFFLEIFEDGESRKMVSNGRRESTREDWSGRESGQCNIK